MTRNAGESQCECRAPALAGVRQGNAYPVAISADCFGGVRPPTHPEVVASQGDPVVLLVSPTVAEGMTKGHWLLSDARLLAAASFVADLRHQYIWDVDVAIATGCAANEEAVKDWRRRCKITWVRKPWPKAWPPDVEQDIRPARARMASMQYGNSS